MKKTLLTLVALLLAFAMCFAFVGCSKDDDKEDKKDDNKTSVSEKADADDKDKEDDKEDEDEDDDKTSESDIEAIVENCIESMYIDCDAESLLKDVHDDVMDANSEEMGGRDVLIETFQSMLDTLKEVEYDLEYEIAGYEDGDLDDIADYYDDTYGLEVEEVRTYTVDMTIEAEGETNDMSATVSVVMIDGEWYLDVDNTEFE